MKNIALSLAVLAVAAAANATVVTFDDLTGAGVVANGYGGINWNGNWAYYDAAQFPYNPASGLERVYTGQLGTAQEFDFNSPVTFDGASFAGYNFNPVSFSLYLSNNLVATSTTLTPSSTPAFLNSGYSGMVDKVVLNGGIYVVMDDVTYNGRGSATPSPAALLPFGLGLVAQFRRRKSA